MLQMCADMVKLTVCQWPYQHESTDVGMKNLLNFLTSKNHYDGSAYTFQPCLSLCYFSVQRDYHALFCKCCPIHKLS